MEPAASFIGTMASVDLPRRDPSTISSNARLASIPRLLSAPPIAMNSTGPDQYGQNTASVLGREVVAIFNVPGNWSGKGQHVTFARGEAIPLEQGAFLGRGAFADVHEVTCKGIHIARKQIHCTRRMKIEDVKRELDILKKLSHKHVVTLLGSYTQGNILGLLLHPAAVCDLGVFLDEVDEEQRRDSTRAEVGEGFSKLMVRLGLPATMNYAKERLNKVYGCLANAVQYLHDNDIRHKDLKPRNILLDKNNALYVTDFGLSRDTTDASSSVSDGIERGTYKYCAPEVARYEPRGRAADIFTLGCVFLEMTTVCRGLSLVEFDEFRGEGGDHSYQNNPKQLKDWMSKLPRTKIYNVWNGMFDMVDIIEKMVSPIPDDRPIIGSVCSSLYLFDEPAYFGDCCASPRYQELVEYCKVLERELIKTKTQVKEIEESNLREKYGYAMAYNSLEQTLGEKKNEIGEIRASYESEAATTKRQHDDRILGIQRERDEILSKAFLHRQQIEAEYEAKLVETHFRHERELAQARNERDTGTEHEQRPAHYARLSVLPPKPPKPPNPPKERAISIELGPPVLPPTPPRDSEVPASPVQASPVVKTIPAVKAIPVKDEPKEDKPSNAFSGMLLRTRRSLIFSGKRDSVTSLKTEPSTPRLHPLYSIPEAAAGQSRLLR